MSLSNILSLLRISLHAMVPITLTAVGEIIGETAGLFNIGLEGALLLSAFAGRSERNSADRLLAYLWGWRSGRVLVSSSR